MHFDICNATTLSRVTCRSKTFSPDLAGFENPRGFGIVLTRVTNAAMALPLAKSRNLPGLCWPGYQLVLR